MNKIIKTMEQNLYIIMAKSIKLTLYTLLDDKSSLIIQYTIYKELQKIAHEFELEILVLVKICNDISKKIFNKKQNCN